MYSGLEHGQFTPLLGRILVCIPEVKIFETLPQKLERDGLTIVHIALARVFPQHAVYYDLFLAEYYRIPLA